MAEQNVAGYFNDIPIEYLISEPLSAACKGQIQLASAAYEFMTKIGFENGDFSKPILLKFNLERPVETPDSIQTNTIEVQAPFLGLVPIPSLLIDDVTIDFQMEVTSTVQDKSSTTAETSVSASYEKWWSPVKISVTGKVTTSRENTRSTNQTAKYQVHAQARQQPPTEGLSKLMDIMASCTAPLSIKGNSGGKH
ncbi:MAG: DUF2589 domain-containing protein [Calditrichaeota bacterium]|nr:MAG: DUF2589 domain-containing protein [Calditrichota bacterium]